MALTAVVPCSLYTPPSHSFAQFPLPSPPPLRSVSSPLSESPPIRRLCLSSRRRRFRSFVSNSSFYAEDGDEYEDMVEEIRIPDRWLDPSTAVEEAEWLRLTLHKWLDDEYCPEPTNIDISKAASESYRRSLLNKTTDLGEILLDMVRQLETISYQESFHGAFSSANAAISLIAQRIETE